jgi:hypothetical protein
MPRKLSVNPEIPKRGRGRPKGSKSKKYLEPKLTTPEKTEALLDMFYGMAVNTRLKPYMRIKCGQTYASILRASKASPEIDLGDKTIAALHRLYGIKEPEVKT